MKERLLLFSCLTLVLLGFSACNWDPMGISEPYPPQDTQLPCNGNPDLCQLAFDEVTYPTTHNAYNYEIGRTQFFQPNQDFPVGRQLRDGIRGLMLDVWEYDNRVIVVHRNQDIIDLIGEDAFVDFMGYEPFSTPLGEIQTFLAANPREVVTLILETNLNGATLEAEFDQAGLSQYLYAPSQAEWPTLGEMIEADTRLVVFTQGPVNASSPNWLSPVWSYCFDTDFSVETPADFNCIPNRGNVNNDLFILNHWITPLLGGGDRASATEVNDFDFLWSRTQDCWQTTGKKPNFVTVDFYKEGDLLTVCDSLNRLP